jgi:hypothetical protein
MAGFPFDDITAPGNGLVTWWTIQNKTYGAIYFSVPLGIPMKTDDGGNAILIDSWLTPANKFHGDGFWLYPANGNVSRVGIVGGAWGNGMATGRWASYFVGTDSSSWGYLGLRCTVPVGYGP